MSVPQISGEAHSSVLGCIGTALLQVKNARGLTLPDMAATVRKSDDQFARYIAGDMEMGAVAWMLAVEAWPELEERMQESAAERAARAKQRALNLELPRQREKAA
jgi:hypothetical protein